MRPTYRFTVSEHLCLEKKSFCHPPFWTLAQAIIRMIHLIMQRVCNAIVIHCTRGQCPSIGAAARSGPGGVRLLYRSFCPFAVARCVACFARRMCRQALPVLVSPGPQIRKPQVSRLQISRQTQALRPCCVKRGKICATGTRGGSPRQSWHFTAEPSRPCQSRNWRPVWT